eukprot:7782323-Prorocentrum_lima.AAC.1
MPRCRDAETPSQGAPGSLSGGPGPPSLGLQRTSKWPLRVQKRSSTPRRGTEPLHHVKVAAHRR